MIRCSRYWPVRAYVVLVLAALLVAPGTARGESGCRQLGRPVGAPLVQAADLFERPFKYGHELQTTGVMYIQFEGNVLCLASEASDEGAEADCIPLTFYWDQLGGEPRQLSKVLEQWNGKAVRVEGIFVATEEGYLGPKGTLRCARSVQLLESPEHRPESFCVGYKGPRPAGENGILSSSPPDNGTRQGNRYVDSGALVHLDATNLSIRIVQGGDADSEVAEVPLPLPPPFKSGWDVWEFQPITEAAFAFTLVDDALYGLGDGVVHRLEDADVDQLALSGQHVWFRSRRFDGETLTWNALKRVNAELEVETLWESTTLAMSHWIPAVPGEIPEIAVRLGARIGSITHDSGAGAWEPVRWVTPRRPPGTAEPSCQELLGHEDGEVVY